MEDSASATGSDMDTPSTAESSCPKQHGDKVEEEEEEVFVMRLNLGLINLPDHLIQSRFPGCPDPVGSESWILWIRSSSPGLLSDDRPVLVQTGRLAMTVPGGSVCQTGRGV